MNPQGRQWWTAIAARTQPLSYLVMAHTPLSRPAVARQRFPILA
jgi:hypothetical protein